MTLLSLVALGAIALVHLGTHRMRWLSGTPRSRALSFASGVSVAYVFLHLLPEIAHGQHLLDELEESRSPVPGLGIYLLALLGLLVFYALDRVFEVLRARGSPSCKDPGADSAAGERHTLFWIHLAIFAVYSFIVGCLIAHLPEGPAFEMTGEVTALAVFTLAIGMHMVVVDFALCKDFPQGWRRLGRFIMVGALLAGWTIGHFAYLEGPLLYALVALLAGGILLNTFKEELPEDRESRTGWLLIGAAGYTVLLSVLQL